MLTNERVGGRRRTLRSLEMVYKYAKSRTWQYLRLMGSTQATIMCHVLGDCLLGGEGPVVRNGILSSQLK